MNPTDATAHVAALRDTAPEAWVPLAVVEAELAGAAPVKAWRDHRGLSHADLARRSGVSQAMVGQIETGPRESTVATLAKLGGAPGTTIDALVVARD